MAESVTIQLHSKGGVTIHVKSGGERSPVQVAIRARELLGDCIPSMSVNPKTRAERVSWRAPSGEGEPVEDSRDG